MPLALLLGCNAAAPPAAVPNVEVPPAKAAPTTTQVPTDDAPKLVKLLLTKDFFNMSSCNHDAAVGPLRCGYDTVGHATGVAPDHELRVFATDPPGLLLAAVDFDRAAIDPSHEATIADCEIDERGTIENFHVGGAEGVIGYVVDAKAPVGVASQCRFEPHDMPRLSASHLVVMHDRSPRSPQTRTREEALVLGRQAATETGIPFEELAARYSDEPGAAQRGGKLGSFPFNAMVPEFSLILLGTPIGARSPLFESQFGFHIAERSAP